LTAVATTKTSNADDVMRRLAADGGRRTAARRVIVEVVLEAEHVTAEEVAARVQQRLPVVTLSTVYRTLAALEEIGVLDHTHLGHGKAVYHLADEGHQHLYCESCDKVLELEPRKLDSFARMLDRDFGFEMNRRHFAIGGRCASCR
jgi:Fur family transcriptional regulator, ferric uptake regulator